ncbi:uncharacterized protein TNCV_3342061 [Trichonephila clavipes]|nr:uncharacterized protein TNCV_3342061 [Trichonephila clavipes]
MGCGSLVVTVSDRGWPCHELKPSTAKDPPCRGVIHAKSVESSIVLPLVWCGSYDRRYQLRCRPRHFTMAQNYEVHRQKLSCS